MPICGVPLIHALLDEQIDLGEEIIEDTFQTAAKPIRIVSNGASRCGVPPSTPHSLGFRLPTEAFAQAGTPCI